MCVYVYVCAYLCVFVQVSWVWCACMGASGCVSVYDVHIGVCLRMYVRS